MAEFGSRFPHPCENFLSAHNFTESVTLHMVRTGFPVGHFSKLKQTPPKFTPVFPVRNGHGGPQLWKCPSGSGLCASRMICVSVLTYFSSLGRFINKLLFNSPLALIICGLRVCKGNMWCLHVSHKLVHTIINRKCPFIVGEREDRDRNMLN